MTKTIFSTCVVVLALACGGQVQVAPPASFIAPEPVPARPTDTTRPLAAVIWTLNYDLREFDATWKWLHEQVPAGAERSRAIGAAALLGVAELDRFDLIDEGVAAFDAAIPAFPTDARLPVWREYMPFLRARNAGDTAGIEAALSKLRAAAKTYPAFTQFGVTLAIGGWEGASKAQLEEAKAAFDDVVKDTYKLQSGTTALDVERVRRIMDTPIAPYNVPAMQAMIGDLALRLGKKDEAGRGYYTALLANNAARWPWRAEVERRLTKMDDVMGALNARPAKESAFGSQGVGAMGITQAVANARFKGRVGNGSCSVCHTHVSAFDLKEEPMKVGWAKVRWAPVAGAPNLQPVALLLPGGAQPIPAGFAIGATVDAAAPRDFYAKDTFFDRTVIIPATPGTYFAVMMAEVNGKSYAGYLSKEMGMQLFVEIKAGEVTDLTSVELPLQEVKMPPG